MIISSVPITVHGLWGFPLRLIPMRPGGSSMHDRERLRASWSNVDEVSKFIGNLKLKPGDLVVGGFKGNNLGIVVAIDNVRITLATTCDWGKQ
jgi:hypothetical protein